MRRAQRSTLAARTLTVVTLLGVVLSITSAITRSPPAAAAEAAPLRIMPLGDSITLGSGPAHSYRGFLWQSLVDAGVGFDFVGSYGNIVPPGGEPTWAWPEDVQRFYNGPIDKDMEGHGGFQAGQPESVVGYKDHMLAQMVPTDIPLFQPDIVLMHIGTNDLLGGWTIHGPWHGPLHDWDRRVDLSAKNVVDLIDSIHALRPQTLILVAPIGKASLGGIQEELDAMSTIISDAVDQRAAQGRKVEMVADAYAGLVPSDFSDGLHLTDTGSRKLADAWFRALQPHLPGDAGGGGISVASVTAAGPHDTGDIDTTTIIVRNTGSAPAAAAIAVTVSGGAAARARSTAIGGTCASSGLSSTCTAPSLAAGAWFTIRTDVAVGSAGTYTVSASPPSAAPTFVEVTTGGPLCTAVGTFGTDTLRGTANNDVLCGFAGNDTLTPGAGDDIVLGGPGADTVVYATVSTGVRADLAAGTATDVYGTAVGTDTLTSVERARGGTGPDELLGDDGANVFHGNGGTDRLVGRGGNDKLYGNAGNDIFDGGPGTDRCVQGTGMGAKTACEAA